MDDTVNNLCKLIECLAAGTNRSPSTISRLATGSGMTYRRLKALGADGRPRHRITTERANRAVRTLVTLWPAYVRWPAGVPRPATISRDAA